MREALYTQTSSPTMTVFASLGGDAQRGQPERVHALLVCSGKAIRVHTREAQLETAVVRA